MYEVQEQNVMNETFSLKQKLHLRLSVYREIIQVLDKF